MPLDRRDLARNHDTTVDRGEHLALFVAQRYWKTLGLWSITLRSYTQLLVNYYK